MLVPRGLPGIGVCATKSRTGATDSNMSSDEGNKSMYCLTRSQSSSKPSLSGYTLSRMLSTDARAISIEFA